MKVVEENFRQLLQRDWGFLHKHIFGYLVDDFAINYIPPKFLSLLLIGKICIGATEMSMLKKYS